MLASHPMQWLMQSLSAAPPPGIGQTGQIGAGQVR